MKPDELIRFDRFRLDLGDERLLKDDRPLPLTPKAFAVLAYLARHPGRRVAKNELLDAVWGERFVSDAVLKVAVREIRKALGDDARAPRFVETVHRRGYRFIAEVGTPAAAPDLPLVGRGEALAELDERFAAAAGGDRQIVFVTGEPGIGKTTLVESFLDARAGANGLLQARGHCLEQFGAGEAYLPVLEALGRLCRGPRSEEVVGLLRRYAPTWLVQMPALLGSDDRVELQRETLGATPERMLREMAEAVEALTATTPLVLVLEDLHWSDYATLDLVSLLARRPEPARLLLVGTYRPADVRLASHPLRHVKRELESRGQGHELPLDYLAPEAMAEYLRRRFPGDERIAELAAPIHRHTDGNPLFMVNVLDYLVAEGRLVERDGRWRLRDAVAEMRLGVPEGIRQLVERQIDRLDESEQRLLEAASVIGVEFSAVAVAAALGEEPVAVEEGCDRLAERHQFLAAAGDRTLPDGRMTARYAFIHSLYQQVLYRRLPDARRRRLHLRAGEGGERIFGAAARELAAELAVHFEQGGDAGRAVRHLRAAADVAVGRYANREAASYLTRALELAGGAAEDLEQRGRVRRAMGDMSGAAADFEALVELARERGDAELEVRALLYLASALYWVRRERCLEVVDRAARRSAGLDDLLLRAHTRGYCAHWNLNLRGWDDGDAAAFRAALAAARRSGDRTLVSLHAVRDVYFRCWQSDYEGAARTADEALELALEVGDAFDYMVCKFFGVWALLHGGRWERVGPLLVRGVEMAERNGHDLWTLLFRVEQAWLRAEAGDPEGAVELCAPAVERAREDPQRTGQLLFKSLIVTGLAQLGRGRHEAAYRCFQEVLAVIDDRHVLMDCLLFLPLHHGLGRYWLARGDVGAARRAARRLIELAAAPGERTYLALGRRTLAEAAWAAGERDEAASWIRRARADLDDERTPLAAWRVHDTAARFQRERGRVAAAAELAGRSAAVLDRLASALAPDGSWRRSLGHREIG